MFKKSLLALALSSVALSASAASVLTTSNTDSAPFSISNQGLPATKAITLVPSATAASKLNLTLKAADNALIQTGGKLYLDITGGLFLTPASALATISSSNTGGLDQTDGTNGEKLTVNTTKSTSTRLVFDMAKDGTGDWTVAESDVILFKELAIIASTSEVSFSAVFAGPTADSPIQTSTAAPSLKTATTADQWKVTIASDTDLDAQIDVGNDRKTFVGTNTAAKTTDTLVINVTTIPATSNDATVVSAKVTVNGDFTGVKTVGGFAIATDKKSASKTLTTTTTPAAAAYLAAGDDTVTLTLETDSAKVVALDERSFDVDVTVTHTTDKTFAAASKMAAGKWELNGVTNVTNYMPFGPNTAPIVQVTSQFAKDAAVNLSYLNTVTGKWVDLGDSVLPVVKANDVTKLGASIASAIMADSGLASGKTKFTLFINAPTNTVTVFEAFKDTADKDRLGTN